MSDAENVRCPHCEETVPPGAYCGSCGGHLGDVQAHRRHSYAASPHESVHRAAVVSTLFPHLPHRHAHVFREVFGGGVAVVILLAALRLSTPATLLAALLLPVLYVLYLYEVEVYEHEPWTVLLATFVAGIGLGTAYTLVSMHYSSLALSGTAHGPFISGVVLPVILQLLMVAGPLLLLSRSHFDETLDGLTFGVAAALGFTLAMVVAGEWHVLTASLRGSGVPADSMLRIVRTGIVAAVVNATTTGLITATLWQRRHGRARGRHRSALRALPASALLAFLVQIGLGLASYFITDLLLVVIVWAMAAMLLLVWLRVVLHHALLDEGAEHHVGPLGVCPECHHVVPAMLFCPVCGAARSAAPKQLRAVAMPTGEAPA
jgi:RsiW-degrading membrane proteinase PrsW (M82 family)